MTRKTKVVLICAIVLVILVAAAIFFISPSQETAAPVHESVKTPDNIQTEVKVDGEKALTAQETRKIIDKIAGERFGEDAFVIFLSTEGPSEIEIDGIKRSVHIYAADSSSAHGDSGNVRGLYHVDVHSGEVFDNGSGSMEKVIIGE